MRVRALTDTGDWTFGMGLSNYKTNATAVAQNIQTRLNMFANDCFFSLNGWIDWLNLQGQYNNVQILQLAVTNMILSTSYVYQILSFSMNVVERNMTLNYTVLTAFGQITVSGQTIGIPINYLLTESGSTITTESGSGLTL